MADEARRECGSAPGEQTRACPSSGFVAERGRGGAAGTWGRWPVARHEREVMVVERWS